MTFGLSPEVAAAVENWAYERGISQVDWIRRAIRHGLVEADYDDLGQSGSAARSQQ
jgi:hypothetical protein